ncbi:multidrug DMT transporter permease [Elizabethkingia anophelis]|uniref:DMT family transporter n=1 Tax=Elizabethkingia anophelis TaxID=1117645 RepID=UPI00099ACB80|nr:DMT family transporter [Elizabethkingia anophelis]MCT3670997.1 DMT family transporter [Elizabethkingia anophelis]MCT3756095.1 DMT family transporter [Elizabethkingia anophelis]MCT4134731.1 DMT family transporter [Elizabethkingia anophelis]MCT4149320.1 DMT family transporter [Elizabethkingia anophelis]MCT4251679.1 DMT family transporter [Elizabethkingia anophelis]
MDTNKEKWVLLMVLTLIWGSSFILIKKSLQHFNPFQVGAMRILIASLILMPLAIKHLKSFPIKQLKWVVVVALCGNFFPMFLFPIAETRISSSIAGIINSMLPIFVIIVGPLLWGINSTKKQMIGVAISFVGACILMLASKNEGGSIEIFPILLLLLATVFYAINVTTVKAKLGSIPAKMLSAYVFSLVLFLPSLVSLAFVGFFTNFKADANFWEGLGFVSLLSVFGTGLAMMLNYRLVNISTPLFSSSVTLLMPIVAVGWGIIDGETLNMIQVAGALLIISGLIFLRTGK